MKPVLLILTLLISTVSFGQTHQKDERVTVCINKEEIVDGQLVLTEVDKPPDYSKGLLEFFKTLSETVEVPLHAHSYKVYVSFIVDTTGSTRDFCVKRKLNNDDNTDLEFEVIKAFKAIGGEWIPGEHKGKKVPVRKTLTVVIDLKKIIINTTQQQNKANAPRAFSH
ncbi:hypothetical protein [Cesiribacter sp. SM1]|uniref:hypothetical protein n=1 Tax=Cesiribacter sp. SM1 TaxID=2861196 RepID=UPI001CD7E322|nr:hypothetical protein [Cesiribacter sp. SM1]